MPALNSSIRWVGEIAKLNFQLEQKKIQTQPVSLGVIHILVTLTGTIIGYPPTPQLKVYVKNYYSSSTTSI